MAHGWPMDPMDGPWQVLLPMATDEGEEAFDPSYMGTAEEVVNERVGDNDFVFIKGCTASKVHRCAPCATVNQHRYHIDIT